MQERLPQTVHWELFGLLPSELCVGTQPLLPRILLTSHCWFPLLGGGGSAALRVHAVAGGGPFRCRKN